MASRWTSPVAGSLRLRTSRRSFVSRPSYTASFFAASVTVSRYSFFSGSYRSSPPVRYFPPFTDRVTHESPSLNFQPQLSVSFQSVLRPPAFASPFPFHSPTSSPTCWSAFLAASASLSAAPDEVRSRPAASPAAANDRKAMSVVSAGGIRLRGLDGRAANVVPPAAGPGRRSNAGQDRKAARLTHPPPVSLAHSVYSRPPSRSGIYTKVY